MSLLDINDTINNDEYLIRQFIKDNYTINGTYTIKNGVFNGSKTVIVDVDSDVYVKNDGIKSLTNGLFRWGIIKGYFDCGSCNNLKSLKGASEKCKSFNCIGCNKLPNESELKRLYPQYNIFIINKTRNNKRSHTEPYKYIDDTEISCLN